MIEITQEQAEQAQKSAAKIGEIEGWDLVEIGVVDVNGKMRRIFYHRRTLRHRDQNGVWQRTPVWETQDVRITPKPYARLYNLDEEQK